MRELFVEELESVSGGSVGGGAVNTTTACCEEGPFGCCGTLDPVWEIVEDLLRP
jgi:hypothetical protein